MRGEPGSRTGPSLPPLQLTSYSVMTPAVSTWNWSLAVVAVMSVARSGPIVGGSLRTAAMSSRRRPAS
jgi:hypothetical protein